ncbi:MAG: hypothetical protein CL483_08790 [Acidobacteria bacterium]|nr:hypothetical protein [Acidobacteriota bacterium]
MVPTATPSVAGRRVRTCRGVVTGDAIVGANIFRDLLAKIRGIVADRSGAYGTEPQRARQIAFGEFREEAMRLGGDSVVGIDLDYEVVRVSLE